MKEYSHVCIDKNETGLATLQQDIANNGLRTADQLGIILSGGSQMLEHHLHVFLWDDSVLGVRRRRDLLVNPETSFLVRVRWPLLTETGWIFSGTLRGDNGHVGPPSGRSTNGAWAYRGSIPADYCFVEGYHDASTDGFENWRSGRGWSGDG